MAKSAAKTSTGERIGDNRGPLTAPKPLPHSLLHSKRILVVSGDLSVHDESKKKLRKIGIEVDTVPTGEIAVLMVDSNRYDLVLLDERLPDMSGDDCAFKLREINKRLPLILMSRSGFDPDQPLAQTSKAGLKQVVHKPFRDDWLNVLESAITKEWNADSLFRKIPPIFPTGRSQRTRPQSSDRDLTSPEPLAHHQDVDQTNVTENRDWASNLSMKDALRVLEEHKAEISDLIFPAVSVLVMTAHRSAMKRVPKESPFQELRELAESNTATLVSSLNHINELFQNLKGVKFRSATELQDAVADIQMIVRRGKFELVLAERLLKLEAGTKVLISSEKPGKGYKKGRFVAAPDNDWAASVRRVSFLPLQLIHHSGGDS